MKSSPQGTVKSESLGNEANFPFKPHHFLITLVKSQDVPDTSRDERTAQWSPIMPLVLQGGCTVGSRWSADVSLTFEAGTSLTHLDPCGVTLLPQQITFSLSFLLLCPTLCNPMNCSMPGFPVLHYRPQFAQTHVH